MVKSTKLQYSVEEVQAAWDSNKPDALTMMLRASVILALETLQRDQIVSEVPYPERSGRDESTYIRAIADWANAAVSQSEQPSSAQRAREAKQHLELVAEIHELLAAADTPSSKSAVAEAVMLGALVGEYKWRSAVGRPQGRTEKYPDQLLDEIQSRTTEKDTRTEAARDLMGEPKHALPKSVHDYAAALAKSRNNSD